MTPDLILGADIGGTSTRIAVADPDGRLLALVRGGPGNPKSVGTKRAAETIADLLSAALSAASTPSTAAVDRTRLGAVTLGLAGLTGIADLAGFVAEALPGVDPGAVTVVPDLVAAFASGTPESSGYVVLAGTGAGAMAIEDGAVTARHDAWGWLLGDDGSGFWLGRQAVRATLASLEPTSGGPAAPGSPPLPEPGPLAREVLRRTSSSDFASLLAAVYDHPALWLAELAPAVTASAATDPVAARICDRAAAALADSFRALRPVPGRTVVTTGSVLNPSSPVRQTLIRTIGSQHPVRPVADGVAGSLWLALRAWHRNRGEDRGFTADSEVAQHERLVRGLSAATPE